MSESKRCVCVFLPQKLFTHLLAKQKDKAVLINTCATKVILNTKWFNLIDFLKGTKDMEYLMDNFMWISVN